MTTLNGLYSNSQPVRRKNFIQENAKNVKRLEQLIHSTKLAKDFKFLTPPKVSSKYESIGAKVNSIPKDSKFDDAKNPISRLPVQQLASDDERKNEKPDAKAAHGDFAIPILKPEKKRNDAKHKNRSKVPLVLNLQQGDSGFDKICYDYVGHKSRGIQTIDFNTNNSEGTKGKSHEGIEKTDVKQTKLENSTCKGAEVIKLYDKNIFSAEEDERLKSGKQRAKPTNKLINLQKNRNQPASHRKGVIPSCYRKQKVVNFMPSGEGDLDK